MDGDRKQCIELGVKDVLRWDFEKKWRKFLKREEIRYNLIQYKRREKWNTMKKNEIKRTKNVVRKEKEWVRMKT